MLAAMLLKIKSVTFRGAFLGHSDSKESACNAGDPDLILWLEQSPGEENGNPLQYSCLEKSMDRAAWWVHGVAESDTTKKLTHTHTHTHTWRLDFYLCIFQEKHIMNAQKIGYIVILIAV